MRDMSIAQAKQQTSKSATDVFLPLEADAIETLGTMVSKGMRMMEPGEARRAAEYILDKLHGRTPDVSQGTEPLWMRVMRKSLSVDGVPVENLPGMDKANAGVSPSSGAKASGEIEEITFEFVWPDAS